MSDQGRLLISCPDRPGIVAAVSQFLFEYDANIVQSDQHSTDPWGGRFFMRIVFELENLSGRIADFEEKFSVVARRFEMNWRIGLAARRKRLAIFVSKEDHCLQELLWQQRAGDIAAEITMVIGNHATLRSVVEPWGIPFHHIPITAATKPEAERRQMELLEGNADAVVLARYMQIVSPTLIAPWQNRMINIHHSFLPAFVGAKPYAQAYERGVKLIGATAHYVTADLDAGPIIEQDVHRVDHGARVDDLKRIGRQIERAVLARAVAWHCEDRILVHGNKTVVFD